MNSRLSRLQIWRRSLLNDVLNPQLSIHGSNFAQAKVSQFHVT